MPTELAESLAKRTKQLLDRHRVESRVVFVPKQGHALEYDVGKWHPNSVAETVLAAAHHATIHNYGSLGPIVVVHDEAKRRVFFRQAADARE